MREFHCSFDKKTFDFIACSHGYVNSIVPMDKRTPLFVPMDTETHIENSTPCPTELEDRLSYLRTQEQQLRKDYDKCIAWRVRVMSIM